MLKTRLTTAAICSAVIIYILSFSPISLFYPLFVTVTTIAIFLSGTEYAALRWNILDGTNNIEQPRPKLKAKHFAVGFSYSFLIITFSISNVIFASEPRKILIIPITWNVIFASEPRKILIIPITWVFLCFFVAAAFIYRRAHDMHTASNKLLNVIAGFIYLALPAVCLTNLSLIQFEGSYRSAQLYFCLATVFMGDTGAYFIGSKFGKHKLIPKVSPKKSIEGALGGLLFSGLTALILTHLFNLPFPPWFSILVGISMGIAGQIGDLMESAFKRAGKYKDSGNLLPGHGGILDRIDSLILAVPVAFLFFSLYK